MKIINYVSCVFRHRVTPDGTLVIKNIEKKDGGVYGCLASNQAGTDTMASILTYIGECHRTSPSISCTCLSGRGLWGARKLVRGSVPHGQVMVCFTFQFALCIILKFCLLFNNSLSLESPLVTVALSDILIGIGETTVMACSASGTPQPEIRWYKGNTFKVEGSKTLEQII